jgi:hypothetical protein
MIAYFLLLHRFPEQFKRLFKSIYMPGNIYLIHVDKTSGPAMVADIAEFLAPYQGAEILPSRRALWGGYSLVDAELRGMKRLLEMDKNWKYYINLSGQDFPLKTQAYIKEYLSGHVDTQFIRLANQKTTRPDTMNRINTIFIEAFQKMFRTGLARKFLQGATPYIGTQWKVVSRRFCEHVCHSPLASRFKRFYRFSFIADESFFQTVMMNGFERATIINDDLRAIDWVPDGDIKLRPRTFTAQDASYLKSSSNLFARKFDSGEDNKILEILEQHLSVPIRVLPVGHCEVAGAAA